MQYKPSPQQKFGLNATPKSNNGGRFTPVNISGTRKCFNCGASDHLRDRCPKLNRSTTDMAGRSAKVSRINGINGDRRAISQPTTTRGACGQRVIIIIIILITDLYSAFRSEDTEALDAAQED